MPADAGLHTAYVGLCRAPVITTDPIDMSLCAPIALAVTIVDPCAGPPSAITMSTPADMTYELNRLPQTQIIGYPTSDSCGKIIVVGDPNLIWYTVTSDSPAVGEATISVFSPNVADVKVHQAPIKLCRDKLPIDPA